MISKNILYSAEKEGFENSEVYGAYKIFFGTLVSEDRLRIINFLRHGKKNVSEIINGLGMGQTIVSHNLARLRKCGFVLVEVDGKFRNYYLNEKTIKPLMELIDSHMASYCIHILKNTKKEVNNEKSKA